MGYTLRIEDHLSETELEKKIKGVAGFWRVRRWMIIYQAKKESVKATELSKRFGVSEATVYALTSRYNRYGIEGIETPGKGQRQRAYLSIDEERDFLQPFIKKAEQGHVSTVLEIQKELEKQLGHSIHKTTMYRILKRQGWRKLMPRQAHTKASKEAQESFKKTLNPR
tara:strand:+ start:181 stop:684 length:504 start_codon:yes stop_codon:yes gene_type:complete